MYKPTRKAGDTDGRTVQLWVPGSVSITLSMLNFCVGTLTNDFQQSILASTRAVTK